MFKDPVFKGRTLAFSSDLSLAAPLKRGLVPALEAITYKTRAQRLLDVLHAGRMRNHEHAYARLFSDAVERVGVIQSVRVAVLEPEDKLLLTVSFDGNWDAYIRTLWVKVGGLLDVIFCNTEGYVEARLHPFEAWAEWVRTAQVKTHFFYGSADGSAHDLLYLRRQERAQQRDAGQPVAPDLSPPFVLPDAEHRARATIDMTDPLVADAQWPRNELMVAEMLRQGLQSLAGLYRLTDLYTPGTADGDLLHRAAHELLQDFTAAMDRGLFGLALQKPDTRLAQRFERQLDWLQAAPPPSRTRRIEGYSLTAEERADVQGGILGPYEQITHGALLLFTFDSAAAGSRFLDALLPQLNAAPQDGAVPLGELRRTLFVSLEGLRRLGVDDPTVAQLPEAFVQGMAARAGLLGDRHDNHPERWTPPAPWAAGGAADHPAAKQRIALPAVHAVVFVRINADSGEHIWALTDAQHPLRTEIDRLAAMQPGARLLAAEPLRRLYRDHQQRQGVHEHFSFDDGNGQPGLGQPPGPTADYPGNNLPYGEVLLGHPGQGDTVPVAGVEPKPQRQPPAWLRNSSFLVVRKYRQHPERFQQVLERGADAMATTPDDVAALLMGRWRDGRPLVKPGARPPDNRFNYAADPLGSKCPLHAHIRRANPRVLDMHQTPGAREARLLRRSLSFGPRLSEDASQDTERGLVFMAYNADIAEQFEVVQRWLTGGHSTASTSGISCPIVGVPEPGRPRWYELQGPNGQPHRFQLDGNGPLLEDAQPLVRLHWGAYWLAPSLSAIRHLAKLAAAAAVRPNVPFDAARGQQLLEALPADLSPASLQAWKAALEDSAATRDFDAASLWAAVRANGGAARCPLGVLVGGRNKVHDLLEDTQRKTSVCGYAERMQPSMGPIYLGLDDRVDGRYRAEADPVNNAIMALPPQLGYDVAYTAITTELASLVQSAQAQSVLSSDPRYELVFDWRELVDEVLARLCECWFGLTTGGEHLARGGFRSRPDPTAPPRYPGHFMAPSRYIFQPLPGDSALERGQADGAALTRAMERWLASLPAGTPPTDPLTHQPAPVGQAIVNHPLATQPGFAARTMVGAVMGFVPTMDGALRGVMAEWLRTDTFARLRGLWQGQALNLQQAEVALSAEMDQALQLRAVPDTIWRTATQHLDLGNGLVAKPGDKLLIGLASAAQESLEAGRPDTTRAMFGGARTPGGAHPTHACPGYEAAHAAMLGALAALLGWADALDPLPGTSSWRISGETGIQLPTAAIQKRPPVARAMPLASGRRIRLLAWGDSWLDYRKHAVLGPRIDLLQTLMDHYPDFEAEGRGGFASYARWGKIETMAQGVEEFAATLAAKIDIGAAPDIILLSGGGNDSTGSSLRPLIEAWNAGGPLLLEPATSAHIGRLDQHYRQVVKRLIQVCADAGLSPAIPIVVQGYDHPFPGHVLDPWLWDEFKAAGYPDKNPAALGVAAQAMAELIGKLNQMLAKLAGDFPQVVHHVDFQGHIAAQWPQNPRDGWSNALHPTQAGFQLLAAPLVARLTAIVGATRPQAATAAATP